MIRVYMINIDKLDEPRGSDDFTDEEFMNIAEEQGTVYSLKGFQDEFNYTDNICDYCCYIRFIEVEE